MSADRAAPAILHADLDAFYASVAQRDDPDLRGRPVAVGAGVVLAASYEARAAGVRSAMGGRRARRLCPDLAVVAPDWDACVAASRAVRRVLDRHAPVVEALSIDEAYLDVAGLARVTGTPEAIGRRIRAEVRDEVGLPITVGGGSTRTLAKVAGAAAKPDGLLVVPPGRELDVLHPLPVERLPGVGPSIGPRLRAAGVATIGDLARTPPERLAGLVGGAAGRRLHALAWNRDPGRVRSGRRRRSVGAQAALGRGPHTPAAVDARLLALVDRVTRRLRSLALTARTVTLRLRFADLARATRSRTLPRATDATATVLELARDLLADARALVARRGLTLVGVALTGLEPALPRQLRLELADAASVPVPGAPRAAGRPAAPARGRAPPADASTGLDTVLDDVRTRFGATAIGRATLLRAGPDRSPWLGPDDADRRPP